MDWLQYRGVDSGTSWLILDIYLSLWDGVGHPPQLDDSIVRIYRHLGNPVQHRSNERQMIDGWQMIQLDNSGVDLRKQVVVSCPRGTYCLKSISPPCLRSQVKVLPIFAGIIYMNFYVPALHLVQSPEPLPSPVHASRPHQIERRRYPRHLQM